MNKRSSAPKINFASPLLTDLSKSTSNLIGSLIAISPLLKDTSLIYTHSGYPSSPSNLLLVRYLPHLAQPLPRCRQVILKLQDLNLDVDISKSPPLERVITSTCCSISLTLNS